MRPALARVPGSLLAVIGSPYSGGVERRARVRRNHGLRLLEGRDLSDADARTDAAVAVIGHA